MKNQQYQFVPLAYGFDRINHGLPCIEGRARIDGLVEAARRIADEEFPWMVFGAGMPEIAKKFGAHTLAHSSAAYLESCHWNVDRIRMCPAGFNTPTELIAVRSVIEAIGGLPYLGTSWWHALRTKLTARVVFGTQVPVAKSRTTLTGHRLRRVLASELVKLPFCMPHAKRACRDFQLECNTEALKPSSS